MDMLKMIEGLYNIEKGVPIPNGKPRSPMYEAASKMEVGDSMLIPYSRGAVAHNLSRSTKFKFKQRKEGEFLRIWRVE